MDYVSDLSWMDNSPSLMHYGKKHMRWGHRNYQQYGHGGYIPKGMMVAGSDRHAVSESTRKEVERANKSGGNKQLGRGGDLSPKAKRELEQDRRAYIKNQRVQAKKAEEAAEKAHNQHIKDTEELKSDIGSVKKVTDDVVEINKKLTKHEEKKLRKKIAKMSDEELEAAIAKAEEEGAEIRRRQNLENQYFNATDYQRKQEHQGREAVNDFMETAGNLLSLAGTGLGIYITIQKLRGKL